MASEQTISRPYAKAAFAFARARNLLTEWLDMLEFSANMAKEEAFLAVLKNPAITRKALLDIIFSFGESVFSDEFKSFLAVLAENRRLALLPFIYEHFQAFKSQSEKVVHVELTSAFELSEPYQQQFAQALKKRMNCEVSLTCKKDERILAGAVIRAGDLLIDGSLKGKIAKLTDAMGIF